MANYALVDDAGNVINRLVLESADDWTATDGHAIHEERGTAYDIGGTFIDGVYSPPVRQVEAVPELTLDEIYDRAIQNQRVLKALVLALNDGSFPVGQNKSAAFIRSAIKAKIARAHRS